LRRALAPAAACAAACGVSLAATAAWHAAPEYVPLFAPAAHAASYEAAVSPTGLRDILRSLEDDEAAVRTPGDWIPRRLPPADAFGRSGAYNRWALARVYGSRQPEVARGARLQNGRVAEAWTLVSPYPAADFSRLEPGTLRIVLKIAP
jgi:hypothetical protein